MPVLITHPDNLATLKRQIDDGQHDNGQFMPAIDVRTNGHMDRDKPTGRFILPGGRVVDRDAVSVEERFVSYGPEDVEFLLFAGIIREERKALFYVINDSAFRIRFDMPLIQPKLFVNYAFC